MPAETSKGRGPSTIPHKEPAAGTESLEAAVQREPNRIKRFLKIMGPGLISGASDDDPSGIGTFSIAGASLGYATLWMALFTLPLMATVQFICARIGMVTGRGVAGVLRRNYPRGLLYPVVIALAIANTINAGVDIGAIAAAINLLVPIPPLLVVIPIGVLLAGLQVFGSYKLIARVFKWLTFALFAYIGAALFARPDAGEVLRATFIPTLRTDARFLATVVALLGTSISPYLFFWQASQEVEEEISMGRTTVRERKGATDKELKYAGLDVNAGMIFSQLVMYFIILATGATLFKAGQTDIQSAAQAAEALRPLAGNMATVLLAIGLIGAGSLAVPVLTGSAGYALAEAFGWKYGLDSKPKEARSFYAAIVGATLVGALINFIGINPMQALFWTGVLNGFLAPPLLVIIMLIANNRKIMGKRTNGWRANLLGWITTAVMFAAAIGLVLTGLGG